MAALPLLCFVLIMPDSFDTWLGIGFPINNCIVIVLA